MGVISKGNRFQEIFIHNLWENKEMIKSHSRIMYSNVEGRIVKAVE